MKRKLFLKTEILQQIGTHTTNLYTRLKICIKIYDLFKRDMENIFLVHQMCYNYAKCICFFYFY